MKKLNFNNNNNSNQNVQKRNRYFIKEMDFFEDTSNEKKAQTYIWFESNFLVSI